MPHINLLEDLHQELTSKQNSSSAILDRQSTSSVLVYQQEE